MNQTSIMRKSIIISAIFWAGMHTSCAISSPIQHEQETELKIQSRQLSISEIPVDRDKTTSNTTRNEYGKWSLEQISDVLRFVFGWKDFGWDLEAQEVDRYLENRDAREFENQNPVSLSRIITQENRTLKDF